MHSCSLPRGVAPSTRLRGVQRNTTRSFPAARRNSSRSAGVMAAPAASRGTINDVDVAERRAAITYATGETESLDLDEIVRNAHLSLICNGLEI